MGSKTYNESFRENAVKTLLSPGSGGLNATARKFDLSPSTLFSWKRKYTNSSVMKKSKKIDSWTPEQKLDAVIKTATMSDEELGEFLRPNGLHSTDLEQLKLDCLPSLKSKGRPRLDPEVVELRQKNKALKESSKKTKML